MITRNNYNLFCGCRCEFAALLHYFLLPLLKHLRLHSIEEIGNREARAVLSSTPHFHELRFCCVEEVLSRLRESAEKISRLKPLQHELFSPFFPQSTERLSRFPHELLG